MSVFVDSSALVALCSRDDRFHDHAVRSWSGLLRNDEQLVSSLAVLVETSALVNSRLGPAALGIFSDAICPVLRWAEQSSQDLLEAVKGVVVSGRSQPSVVDRASFALMRRLAIPAAFAFDPHFAEQGFALVPPATRA